MYIKLNLKNLYLNRRYRFFKIIYIRFMQLESYFYGFYNFLLLTYSDGVKDVIFLKTLPK